MPSKPIKAIAPMFGPNSWKIVRGDMVQVMAGKDKGKKGEVLRVIRDERFPRVFVSGLNMVTRHVRAQPGPSNSVLPGFTVKFEAPMHYSNVMLLDPETNAPVRSYFVYEDTPPFRRVRKTRGSKASNCIIPWPQKWRDDPKPNMGVGALDTRPEDAAEVTLDPAADFTLVLPAAHRRLREMRQLRDAAAAAQLAAARQAAAAARRTQPRQRRQLLGSSAAREYQTSACSSSSGCSSSLSGLSGDQVPQLGGIVSHGSSWMRLLQQSRVPDLAGGTGRSMHTRVLQHLGWCGLAAAPAVLLL